MGVSKKPKAGVYPGKPAKFTTFIISDLYLKLGIIQGV